MNALAAETSPYLRGHASNPVDWLPWGPSASAAAHERDVPLLVSIGYSSCHWCHVMERESFADPRTAELMNAEFVCVKVDREERPDVDALYMEAVVGMTGHGGWPLNVFLTPDGLPFYGGTYFPPEPRAGMPSWTQVLLAVAESWRENADEIRSGGERIRERLSGGARLEPSSTPFDVAALDGAVARLRESFDAAHGGFGSPPAYAPKFPQASVLEFLLRFGERSMSLATLRSMARGGIHDQIGGGFHRYAVDASWTVPHFEKMLYDNALLARAYLHGYRVAGDEEFARVCRSTLDWALREMSGPDGGFCSALDADSDSVEGRFYVWTVSELEELLGPDADAAIGWLGVTAEGNFLDPHHPLPGLCVLTDRGPRPDEETVERIRARLSAARARRTPPFRDDKRITSWNALMVAALADAAAVLGGEDGLRYLDAAERCADFLLRDLRDGNGRLLRIHIDGSSHTGGCLEDYAFLLEALVVLFEATCSERRLLQARSLADEMIARFADPSRGGFFSTPSDGEVLIARRKDLEDSPIPSGASAAASGLLRLAQITGETSCESHALGVLRLLHEIAPLHPTSFGHLLQALLLHLSPARGLACAVPPTKSRGTDPTPIWRPAPGSPPTPPA